MKKDIEWLVQMINEELDILRQRLEAGEGTPNQNTFDEGRGWALSHVLRMMYYPDKLDELSKELPVLPKYVADWIEDVKPDNSLRVAFEYIAERKADNHDDPLAFWIEEGNSETFARAWLDGYVVEEEPLYYALIKGHELIAGEDACKYWKCDMRNGSMFLSNRYSHYGRYLAEMSENDWGKFGINDTNADFVRVDD